MSASDAAPLPRLGEVFFDVRGSSRSMRLSWYANTGIAVFSIWQGGTCTGTFRLPLDELSRLVESLSRGLADGPVRPVLARWREACCCCFNSVGPTTMLRRRASPGSAQPGPPARGRQPRFDAQRRPAAVVLLVWTSRRCCWLGRGAAHRAPDVRVMPDLGSGGGHQTGTPEGGLIPRERALARVSKDEAAEIIGRRLRDVRLRRALLG